VSRIALDGDLGRVGLRGDAAFGTE